MATVSGFADIAVNPYFSHHASKRRQHRPYSFRVRSERAFSARSAAWSVSSVSVASSPAVAGSTVTSVPVADPPRVFISIPLTHLADSRERFPLPDQRSWLRSEARPLRTVSGHRTALRRP